MSSRLPTVLPVQDDADGSDLPSEEGAAVLPRSGGPCARPPGAAALRINEAVLSLQRADGLLAMHRQEKSAPPERGEELGCWSLDATMGRVY